MTRCACAAVVVFMAVLAGSAMADQTVTLRQGLGGYTGVEDTMLESHGNFNTWWAPYANLGEASQGLRLYGNALYGNAMRSALVKFDGLDTAIPVTGSASIVSATLSLNQGDGGLTSVVDLYKCLHGWVEGTGKGANGPGRWDNPDVKVPVDGASHRFWNAPVVLDASGWTDEGVTTWWNNIYSMDVTGKTIGHVMYDKLEYAGLLGGWNAVDGWRQSTAATVDEMKNNDVDLEWLQIGDTLYVDHNMADEWTNPGETDEGICYYLASDAWGANGADGDTDIDKADSKVLGVAVDDWRSVDVTDWVKAWFDDPSSNHGFAVRTDDGDLGFFSSEGADPVTGIGDIDVLLGPTLTITYVPEPATMGLLSLGFAGLAALRRRKK